MYRTLLLEEPGIIDAALIRSADCDNILFLHVFSISRLDSCFCARKIIKIIYTHILCCLGCKLHGAQNCFLTQECVAGQQFLDMEGSNSYFDYRV